MKGREIREFYEMDKTSTTLKTRNDARMRTSESVVRNRVFAVLSVVMVAAMIAGCAAPQKQRRSGSVGRPPPEQVPVVYNNQNRSGPLITPQTDPFAIR